MSGADLGSAALHAQAAGFRQPPEWFPHQAVWSAWPDHPDWGPALERAKSEVASLFRAIAHDGQGERLCLLVRDAAAAEEAKAALDGVEAELHVGAPFGDIWLRDTAPIFVWHPGTGEVRPVCFRFNGWGGKYRMAGDEAVAAFVAGRWPSFSANLVLEGGSVDTDGEGTLLTTRQCLLEPHRNPGLDAGQIEARLKACLGADKVLWLGEGLKNDHTDGHVDTLARFVAPGRVVCMRAREGDPNREALEAIEQDLERMVDARGRRLEVRTIPSPGTVVGSDGALLPASYVNFYVSNTRVLVPTYGVPQDEAAVEGLARLFYDREVIGLPARGILEGGGTFHCITQQEPRSGLRAAGAGSAPAADGALEALTLREPGTTEEPRG